MLDYQAMFPEVNQLRSDELDLSPRSVGLTASLAAHGFRPPVDINRAGELAAGITVIRIAAAWYDLAIASLP